MTINLYNTSSAPNALTKALGDLSSHSGTVRGEINVVRPVIDIVGNIHGYNYAEIPNFNNRKYFIEEMKIVRDGITRVTLKCDVLSSFADSIKACGCVCKRTETQTDQTPFIFDSKRPMLAYNERRCFIVKEFYAQAGTLGDIILVTSG